MGIDEGDRQGMKTTIIEAYPGPGTFTRAFMEHPAVEKVISMENVPMFLSCLEQLRADSSMGDTAEKLHIIPESGYSWDTYETLVKDKHLSHLEGKVPKLGPHAPPMDWNGTLFYADVSAKSDSLFRPAAQHRAWRAAICTAYARYFLTPMALPVWPCQDGLRVR